MNTALTPQAPTSDLLDGAPPEDRETLRAALVELARTLGPLPEPEIQPESPEDNYALLWKVPEGFILLAAPRGVFSWYAEGSLFRDLDETSLPWGDSVRPTAGSPEALYGGTLIPRFERLLARYAVLDELRGALLRELNRTDDPKALLRELLGPVMKALPPTRKDG